MPKPGEQVQLGGLWYIFSTRRDTVDDMSKLARGVIRQECEECAMEQFAWHNAGHLSNIADRTARAGGPESQTYAKMVRFEN